MRLVVINARGARRAYRLVLFFLSTHGLFEYRFGFIDLKLGLEVLDIARETAAIGPTACVVEVEIFI